jgi:hypothetical protein
VIAYFHVMAVLDTAIQRNERKRWNSGCLDGRNKSGHDESRC